MRERLGTRHDTSLLRSPPIRALAPGVKRPLWSVMIPTFNCANYLRLTLQSVLAQDPGPDVMQIEVVDDCSTKDDPESVVREVGKERVQFHRKPKNAGAIANFNTCIERSRGELIHILHGDDLVLAGFYQRLTTIAERRPDLTLFGCRSFFVDEDGFILSVNDRVRSLEAGGCDVSSFFYGTAIQTAAAVVRRSFYEVYGGFLPELVHTADCEMWTRAIGIGGGIIVPDVMCQYRVFSANDTGRLMRTGENLRDIARLNAIMAARFPEFDHTRGMRRLASMARVQMARFRDRGDREAFMANRQFYRAAIPWPWRLAKSVSCLRTSQSVRCAVQIMSRLTRGLSLA